MVELLYLAYLEVVSPFSHQQDAELLVVELSHPALHFVLTRVLADVLSLNRCNAYRCVDLLQEGLDLHVLEV